MSITLALPLAVLIGAVLGLVMRAVMGHRIQLGWAEAVLSGIIGAVVGSLIEAAIPNHADRHWGLTVLAAAICTSLVMLIVGFFTRKQQPTAAELIAAGESRGVEFKSTARCNLHTGERDDKIELIVAKTVAAFSNSEGGDLLIGVDDNGNAIGLDNDLKFMKSPDLDRFELWLRDYLANTLGDAATAGVIVDFPRIGRQPVCHIHVDPATRPIFLNPGRSQPPQMWVRAGNSTRQLQIDEALRYSADRWDRRRLR